MPNTLRHMRIGNTKRTSYYINPENFMQSTRSSLCNHAKLKLLYNELAPIFDLAIVRNTQKEVDFLDEVIQLYMPKAKKILDLGCGVGRHAELLSHVYKYAVTGVDISKRMVKLAKIRCPDCKFVTMDMRDIQLKGNFDAAICMWTTFNYISNQKDIEHFFISIREVIVEKGLLIIDVNNYKRPEKSSYNRRAKNDLYEVCLNVTKRRIGNMSEGLYSYSIKDLKTNQRFHFLDQELNMIYNLEDVVIAAKPFFDLLNCYGDYDTSKEFNPDKSERIISVFRKKG